MEMNRLMGWIYQFCRWITTLAYINILWITFTLIGIVFLGFFPATVAMFTVVKKLVIGETNIPISKTFWQSYRTEFWKINCLGFILLLIGIILYVDLAIFSNREHFIYLVHRVGLIAIFLIFMVFCMFIFPIYTHFDLKFSQYFKRTFAIIFLVPIRSLGMILSAIGLYFVMLKLPGLILFFSGSVLSFVCTWIAYKAILSLQYRYEETL
ncbi:YesL family protein [Virgibacillus ndiopensis]|uniref:YesL family protein n=1 Tax=Virgibacillus ndiopensis TaxID=2004408 RepID=UPI000C08B622|nr:DUF624 domain-containing protein [Virgibacillus ndiopensis]